MWKDKLLKKGWRIFVVVLYAIMIGSIVLRLFPLPQFAKDVITFFQVLASICFLVFAWFYYNKSWLVRNEEVE
jgi:glucan phosphoethanolaminetransferase (alkaline phosphatase superfamily)